MSSTKKEWTIDETHRLISNYENNPCLWNPKDVKYKDKLAKGEAVRQLAVSFNTTESEIQRKLHGLRNQHADESRKEKITRTGQGADEMYKSKWIYLESLTFVSTEDNIIRKLFLTNIPVGIPSALHVPGCILPFEVSRSKLPKGVYNDLDVFLVRK
ncbi:hypothetical protein QTP88_013586 [Uroleucon formosanum]